MVLLVFDLDETLTDFDSGDTIAEAWKSRKNYDKVRGMLKHLLSQGHRLAVLSRGVRTDVVEFLENTHLLQFFEVVIGATSESQNRNKTDKWWGDQKTKYLKALKDVFGAGDDMVFVDDMAYNVVPARKAGFTVFHVNPPGSETTVKLVTKHVLQ